MSIDLFDPPAPPFDERNRLRRRAHLLREIERTPDTPGRRQLVGGRLGEILGRDWPLRSLPRKAALVLVLAVAIAVAAAVVPERIGHRQDGLIARAIAAIGTGRTTHLVLVGTVAEHVDLATGKRTPQEGRTEIWADPKLGTVGFETVDGKPLRPLYIPPAQNGDELDQLRPFVKGYRSELVNGDYHPVGKATIAGQPVEWIADKPYGIDDQAGVEHFYVQELAISRTTFKPLYLRTRVDGVVEPGSQARVITAETVPPRPALYTHKLSAQPLVSGTASAPATTLRAARAAMSPDPIVPPARLAGLRRTWVGLPRLVAGPINAVRQVNGVELFYGPTNFLGQPLDKGSFISITEFPDANPFVTAQRPAFPANGAIVSGGTASLKTHGLYIIINAATSKQALAAARALAR